MYDLIVMAGRPQDWTHAQFIEWWRGPHAEVTMTLPGLRAWRHFEVDRALELKSEGWDGVSILSFDSSMRGRRLAVLGPETVMVSERPAERQN